MDMIPFTIKKGRPEERDEFNIADEEFYILRMGEEEAYAGKAEWHAEADSYIITALSCAETDPRIFDALLRAVAFAGTKHFIRYVFYSCGDDALKQRMCESIFAPVNEDAGAKQRAEELGLKGSVLSVDVIACFSGPCAGSKHAE